MNIKGIIGLNKEDIEKIEKMINKKVPFSFYKEKVNEKGSFKYYLDFKGINEKIKLVDNLEALFSELTLNYYWRKKPYKYFYIEIENGIVKKLESIVEFKDKWKNNILTFRGKKTNLNLPKIEEIFFITNDRVRSYKW